VLAGVALLVFLVAIGSLLALCVNGGVPSSIITNWRGSEAGRAYWAQRVGPYVIVLATAALLSCSAIVAWIFFWFKHRAAQTKRFRQWLLNGLAAMSLILGIATVAFWVRGYWIADSFKYTWSSSITDSYAMKWPPQYKLRNAFVGLSSSKGVAMILGDASGGYVRTYPMGLVHQKIRHGNTFWPPNQTVWNHLGFWAGSDTAHGGGNSGEIHNFFLIIPFWLVLLLAAAMPLRWVYIYRRDRHPRGFCTKCGYDLRATPDRCPECGLFSEKAAVAS
jgi:hypothetical protein